VWGAPLQTGEHAAEAIQGSLNEKGAQLVVLSDRLAGPDRYPIPSLLAVGAVHQHLLQTKQRPRAGLFVECGDAREVHDMATLLGYGADGICPYVGFEALFKMNADGHVRARANEDFTDAELAYQYRKVGP
jgi:glutamate synthase (NADH)